MRLWHMCVGLVQLPWRIDMSRSDSRHSAGLDPRGATEFGSQ